MFFYSVWCIILFSVPPRIGLFNVSPDRSCVHQDVALPSISFFVLTSLPALVTAPIPDLMFPIRFFVSYPVWRSYLLVSLSRKFLNSRCCIQHPSRLFSLSRTGLSTSCLHNFLYPPWLYTNILQLEIDSSVILQAKDMLTTWNNGLLYR